MKHLALPESLTTQAFRRWAHSLFVIQIDATNNALNHRLAYVQRTDWMMKIDSVSKCNLKWNIFHGKKFTVKLRGSRCNGIELLTGIGMFINACKYFAVDRKCAWHRQARRCMYPSKPFATRGRRGMISWYGQVFGITGQHSFIGKTESISETVN